MSCQRCCSNLGEFEVQTANRKELWCEQCAELQTLECENCRRKFSTSDDSHLSLVHPEDIDENPLLCEECLRDWDPPSGPPMTDGEFKHYVGL
jgi:hypothetical protein